MIHNHRSANPHTMKLAIGAKVIYDPINSPGTIIGYTTAPYEEEPYQYIVTFTNAKNMLYINKELLTLVSLSISDAEYLGTMALPEDYECPINHTGFLSGDEIVVIIECNTQFIYDKTALESFWLCRTNTNLPYTNPVTNSQINSLKNVKRYTVI